MEELARLGEEYVHGIRSTTPGAYEQWRVVESAPGGPYNDGRTPQSARKLVCVGTSAPSQAWLDEPLFEWNGSTTRPAFQARYNPTIGSSECAAIQTVSLACSILEDQIPSQPDLETTLLQRIGATFCAGATPRMLMDGISDNIGFVCKDDSQPETDYVNAELFFGNLALGRIVAFDLHDIAHHAAQLQQWPDFYTRLGDFASKAFAADADDESRTIRQSLSVLLSDALFEESILQDGDDLYSFGCLNWLSSRDTPAAALSQSIHASDETIRLNQRWHMLFALKDLYRTQAEASSKVGSRQNWLQALGYEADARFVMLAEQRTARPLAGLDLATANEFEIHAPRTAQELFDNANKLLDDYS